MTEEKRDKMYGFVATEVHPKFRNEFYEKISKGNYDEEIIELKEEFQFSDR